MATNDFLPFAGGAGANALPQADYAALAARTSGFGSGILLSENLNKALRQGSIMAAVLAQFIADNSGDNVVDDGTTATIESSLVSALTALWTSSFTGSNQSLGSGGYQKFPGGLILQWGITPVVAAANTLYTASLPITFPNNGRSIVALYSNINSPSSFVQFNMNFNPTAGVGPASQYRYSASAASAQAFFVAIGN